MNDYAYIQNYYRILLESDQILNVQQISTIYSANNTIKHCVDFKVNVDNSDTMLVKWKVNYKNSFVCWM